MSIISDVMMPGFDSFDKFRNSTNHGVLQSSKVTLKRLTQEITAATNNNEEVWITIE